MVVVVEVVVLVVDVVVVVLAVPFMRRDTYVTLPAVTFAVVIAELLSYSASIS